MQEKDDLRYVDKLPDGALISIPILAALAHQGVSTTWRKLKTDPTYPKVIRLGNRCSRVRLGDARALLRGEAA